MLTSITVVIIIIVIVAVITHYSCPPVVKCISQSIYHLSDFNVAEFFVWA